MVQKETELVRFHSLDALRGIAALAVVFWHWQHFFLERGSLPNDFKPGQMLPMFDTLRILYERGWLAVDLFFSLSGFIFFWLYANTINDRRVSGQKFFVLRLSRLYPLHLFTLLAVGIEQVFYSAIKSNGFVYQFNDLRHFALNLVLLPSIGLEKGYSFNGPAWSVSVEVVLYIAFFALCRVTKSRPMLVLGITLAAFLLDFYNPIHRGCRSFFLGGCIFHLYQTLSMSRNVRRVTSIISTATIMLWIATLACYYLDSSPGNIPLLWGLGRASLLEKIPFAVIILFPCTILCLAMLEKTRGTFLSRISFLGNISYSSYLLHFPLQILFAFVAIGLNIGAEFFSSKITMGVFFMILIGASLISYHWLEMPAQRYIRSKLLNKSPKETLGRIASQT